MEDEYEVDDYDFGDSEDEFQLSDILNEDDSANDLTLENNENDLSEINQKNHSNRKKGPFSVLGINDDLIFSLEKRFKFRQPSPIQRKVIPLALQGRDILCIARTGSGKTISYLVPIVQKLKCHSTRIGSRCLIILPSRELSLQVTRVLRRLLVNNDLKIVCLIGGQGIDNQFSLLVNNPDIIIATPGRLVQHLVEKSLELIRIEIFILDEADKLCEDGFLPHIYKIVSQLPSNKQTLVVSATLPTEIAEFSKFNLKDPIIANVDKDHQISKDLRVDFIYVRSDFKIAALYKIANKLKDKSTIIFTATRHHVEFFKLFFDKSNLKASYVYGSMDMSLRIQQMANFSNSKTNFLIVTDVAARGLDIPIVNNVINYDFPYSSKLFIHRSGRTARAGRTGVSVSLVTLQDLSFTNDLEVFLGNKIEIAKNELRSCLIGSIGNLDNESEYVESLLSSDIELQRLYRSMNAALNLYYKTRPLPSRSSVLNAKNLLSSCGGITTLINSIHPYWGDSDSGITKSEFIKALNNFRPEKTRLAVNGCETFEKYKNIDNFIQNIQSNSYSNMENSDIGLDTTKSHQNHQNRCIRKSLIACTTSSEDFTRRHEMRLPDMTLNINPDSESDLQRKRYTQKIRWDSKKKKFIQNIYDNITNQVYKNESGVKVRGEIESKGLLKKWMTTSKIRLQKTGEVEEAKSAVIKPSKVEADNDYSEISNPKYAALIESYRRGDKLTHKETRLLKKITGNISKSNKPNSRELKTPLQIQKSLKKPTKASRIAKFKRRQEVKMARQSAPSRSIKICKRI